MAKEWAGLHTRLRRHLAELDGSSIVVLQTAAPPIERSGRRWWQRTRIEPSPDAHLVQLMAYPEGEILATLAGSTLIGGTHDVGPLAHEEVLAAGWTEPGDPGHPGQGGEYARWAKVGDDTSLDALTDAVVEGLTLLGARADQEWTFTHVQ